jgi:hypothetical protein
LEVNLEKLFVAVFSIESGVFVNVDTVLVFARNKADAANIATELLARKFEFLEEKPKRYLQQLIEVDDQLITKAYNNLPSTNNN